MAILVGDKTLTIWKHESTGIVDLCHEVSDYIRDKDYIIDKVDPTTARFATGPHGELQVVFDYKE